MKLSDDKFFSKLVLVWWYFRQCFPPESFLSRDLCSPCSRRQCWSCAQHTHSFYCFYSMFSYRENWCKMALAQVGIESWDSHLLLAQQRVRFPDISFLQRESNKTRQEGIITGREYWNGWGTGNRNSRIITHQIWLLAGQGASRVPEGGNNSWFSFRKMFQGLISPVKNIISVDLIPLWQPWQPCCDSWASPNVPGGRMTCHGPELGGGWNRNKQPQLCRGAVVAW